MTQMSSALLTGYPVRDEPELLVPWLRSIAQATDYAWGRRLVAMLPEWIPANEQPKWRMAEKVREKLLRASGQTLDRLLEPWRGQGTGRLLRRPRTGLRQMIFLGGRLWKEGRAGWGEVDTWRYVKAVPTGSPLIMRRRGWKCTRCGPEDPSPIYPPVMKTAYRGNERVKFSDTGMKRRNLEPFPLPMAKQRR